MICKNCGKELPEGTKKCDSCGKKVKLKFKDLPKKEKIKRSIIGCAFLLLGAIFMIGDAIGGASRTADDSSKYISIVKNGALYAYSEQTVGDALQLRWRPIGGQEYTLAVAEEMVEDMEECVLCALLVLPLLYIVNNQHIDGLVEVDKVVYLVLYLGRGVLHLEGASAEVQHTLVGVQLARAHTNSINKVCLATARRAVDEEGVKLWGVRMFGQRLAHRTRQLVAHAFYTVVECLLGVELRVESGYLGLGLLCQAARACRSARGAIGFGLRRDGLAQMVLLIGHYTVAQTHFGTEVVAKGFTQ